MNVRAKSGAPLIVLNYSFSFRYRKEDIYSVAVPLERLLGKDLSVDTVRITVEEDEALLGELLGDDLDWYELLASEPGPDKRLERQNEKILLVEI